MQYIRVSKSILFLEIFKILIKIEDYGIKNTTLVYLALLFSLNGLRFLDYARNDIELRFFDFVALRSE